MSIKQRLRRRRALLSGAGLALVGLAALGASFAFLGGTATTARAADGDGCGADPVAGDEAQTDERDVAAALLLNRHNAPSQAKVLPGPTGESNRLTSSPRPPVLCLGPSVAAALKQAGIIRALGGHSVEAPGLAVEALSRLNGFSGAIWWGDEAGARARARVLAARKGPILPLIGGMPDVAHVQIERHVCIDTTASGGNAQLLAEVSGA